MRIVCTRAVKCCNSACSQPLAQTTARGTPRACPGITDEPASADPASPVGDDAQFPNALCGRFDGDERRNWFLSDGAHFENTGAYALLSEECELIVVADATPTRATPSPTRRTWSARRASTCKPTSPHCVAQRSTPTCREPMARSTNRPRVTARRAWPSRARCRHSGRLGQMFIVKPNMCQGVPVDLVKFNADNPLFLQGPTTDHRPPITDRLSSEAQRESCLQLGQTLGGSLHIPPLRVGDAACTDRDLGAFRQSNLMGSMIQQTKAACEAATSPHPFLQAHARREAHRALPAGATTRALRSLVLAARLQSRHTRRSQLLDAARGASCAGDGCSCWGRRQGSLWRRFRGRPCVHSRRRGRTGCQRMRATTITPSPHHPHRARLRPHQQLQARRCPAPA